MKFNYIIYVFLILIVLFSISSVVAIDDENMLNSTEDNDVYEIIDGETIKEDPTDKSFTDLANEINTAESDNITLDGRYVYNEDTDSVYKDGIMINKEKSFTINGNNLSIDGNNQARAFRIAGPNNIILNAINFTNCYSEDNGGAIYSTGNLTIIKCYFLNNVAKDGASIYNDGATLNLTSQPNFFHNTSITNYHGNIVDGSVSLFNSTFRNIEGNANLSRLYLCDYWGDSRKVYNKFTNLRGNINIIYGDFYNTTFINDNGDIKIGYYVFDSTGHQTIYGTAYFKYCNFTNIGGNIKLGDRNFNESLITLSNDYITAYFERSNFTNIGGNITYLGSFYYDNLINDHGKIDFISHYYYTGYDVRYAYTYFQYGNFTNLYGDISIDIGNFYYYNLTNDHGNISFNSRCESFKWEDRVYNTRTEPYFSQGTLKNIHGNFSSQSIYLSYTDIINEEANFVILNGKYKDPWGDQEHVTQPYLSSFSLKNSGNFTTPGFLNTMDIENNGTVNFNIMNLYSAKIINNGNFNIDHGEDYDVYFLGDNNIVNNGNFTLSHKSDVSTYNFSNITNYGNFEINGRDETTNISTHNINNYGNLILINATFENGNLSNEGNIESDNNMLSNNIINNGDIKSVNDKYDKATISNTGNFDINHYEIKNVTITNTGVLNTAEGQSISINASNSGHYNISNSWVSNINATNINGTFIIDQSQVTLSEITNENSTFLTKNCLSMGNNLTNTNSSMISENDLYSGCSLSSDKQSNLTLVNDKLFNMKIENNNTITAYGNNSLMQSSIDGGNLTNHGNMELIETNLSNVDLFNTNDLKVHGGSVDNVTLYNDGTLTFENSNISSSEIKVDSIISNNLTTVHGSGISFNANFTDAKGNALINQEVIFKINGKEYSSITDSKGLAELNQQLNAGKYIVEIFNPVSGKSENYTYIINKEPAKLTVNKITYSYGSRKYLTVKITDNENKPVSGIKVSIKLNKKTYNVITKSNGVAMFKIPVLKVGKYKATVKSDDVNYNIASKNTNIIIKKAKTKVKVQKSVKKSKKLKITIKSKVTKKAVSKVKIKVKVYTGKKAKTYKIKTNKKGVAKLKTKKLTKGKHKLVIKSLNKNYKISKKIKIRIK